MATRKRFEPRIEVDATGGQARRRGVPALGEKFIAALLRVIPALIDAVELIESLDGQPFFAWQYC